jgi:hypothetical protein
MLQISSGKFFKTDKLYVTRHRGVLYGNYRLTHDIDTAAGSLRSLEGGGDIRGVLYEGDERLEAVAPDGRPEFLVSVGGAHLLHDFAAVTAFALSVTCTADLDLAHRLTHSDRLPLGVPRRPSAYVVRVFDPTVEQGPGDGERLRAFVDSLLALERRGYEAAMRAIRRYVTGLHRIGDDLDLAYTLLVASVESLAQQFDDFTPRWEDYDAAKRKAIDTALLRTHASVETREAIRGALLEHEHAALARRFREFALRHVTPAFFRDEAVGVLHPIRHRDLSRMLGRAYRMRSSYVHELRELPRILTLGPSDGDTVVAHGDLVLTFQGMARVARHVIWSFIASSRKVDREDFNYRRALPNILTVQLADSFWLNSADGYGHATSRRYLSGFLRELSTSMLSPRSNPTPATAMPDVLVKVEKVLPGLAKPSQKLPLLALYVLWHRTVTVDGHRSEWQTFVERHARIFDVPSIESLLVRVILGVSVPWPAERSAQLLLKQLTQGATATALVLPPLFEAALALAVADAFRADGARGRALEFIALAASNLPGHSALVALERQATAGEIPLIDWRVLLLPPAGEPEAPSSSDLPADDGSQQVREDSDTAATKGDRPPIATVADLDEVHPASTDGAASLLSHADVPSQLPDDG